MDWSSRGEPQSRSFKYLKSAFMAIEPAISIVSIARQCGKGCIAADVQTFLLEYCIRNMENQDILRKTAYVKNILKGIITAAESTCVEVIDGLYEELAGHMGLSLDPELLMENKVCKHITFYVSDGNDASSSSFTELVIPLQCSLNMLEGDTGCALWPSSLYLSEFVLSYPQIFSKRYCFEVGSGVGLVGICLAYAGASKVMLTDGDISTVANMIHNVDINHLANEMQVECKHMPWETVSESTLKSYHPDIVLGADIIYNPECIPDLIRILSILLNTSDLDKASHYHKEEKNKHCGLREPPVAYIATVIRNPETMSYFLNLASDMQLFVDDISEQMKPQNMLPYMLSYDRSAVHLYRISHFSSITSR